MPRGAARPEPPATGARGEGTRGALLAAALRVVEREGVAAATTRRVAAEAGLPLGAVHYWFRDKRQLLAAVVEALLGEVRAEAAGPAADDGEHPSGSAGDSAGGSGLDRLADVHRRLAGLPAGRQLALVELTTHALRDPDLAGLAREQYAEYRTTALRALGGLADDADAHLPGGSAALAALVVAVLDGLTLSTLAGGSEREAQGAVDLLLHLLRGALPGTG